MFIKLRKSWKDDLEFNEVIFRTLGIFGFLLKKILRGAWSCTIGELASRADFEDLDLLEVLVVSNAWRFGIEVQKIKPYRRTYRFFFRCPDDYDCLDASGFDGMSCEEIGRAMVDGSLILDKDELMWYDESLLDGKPESFRKWVERLTLDKLNCTRQEIIIKTLNKGWIDVQN